MANSRILNPQSSILNPQFSILNSQFTFRAPLESLEPLVSLVSPESPRLDHARSSQNKKSNPKVALSYCSFTQRTWNPLALNLFDAVTNLFIVRDVVRSK